MKTKSNKKKTQAKKLKSIFARIKALKLLWPNTNRDENIFFFFRRGKAKLSVEAEKVKHVLSTLGKKLYYLVKLKNMLNIALLQRVCEKIYLH